MDAARERHGVIRKARHDEREWPPCAVDRARCVLQEWRESAPPMARWYLDTIALPGAPVFARLVLVGELAAGAALVCGIKVRLAATVSLLMVLNFHFASDVLFHYSYLTNAYGLPVLGGLLALAIGGGTRLPFSLSK